MISSCTRGMPKLLPHSAKKTPFFPLKTSGPKGWDALATARGNGALPAAFLIGQKYAGLRLKEMGQLAGGLEYPAVNAAIARFEKRLKIDRELQKKIKKVAKELNIEF